MVGWALARLAILTMSKISTGETKLERGGKPVVLLVMLAVVAATAMAVVTAKLVAMVVAAVALAATKQGPQTRAPGRRAHFRWRRLLISAAAKKVLQLMRHLVVARAALEVVA